MEVIPTQAELTEFSFEVSKFHAEVEHGTDEHVTADPAEDVQVKAAHERGACRVSGVESAGNSVVRLEIGLRETGSGQGGPRVARRPDDGPERIGGDRPRILSVPAQRLGKAG